MAYTQLFQDTHSVERKEGKNSTLECKENGQMLKTPDVKNVNKRKNRLTPVKLESKNQHKKAFASPEGSGRKIPSNVKKKPRSIQCPMPSSCNCE